jgi:hypothetical protein
MSGISYAGLMLSTENEAKLQTYANLQSIHLPSLHSCEEDESGRPTFPGLARQIGEFESQPF